MFAASQQQSLTGVTFSFMKEANVPYNIGPSLGNNTNLSGTGSFFSPQLSTDFTELPQSLREKREIYRHFYNSDPLVGQAIDLHTELPLSKIRLSPPKPTMCPPGFESPHEYGKYIHQFFTKMCARVKLFQRFITMVHEYWLQGSAFPFAEDSDVQIPPEVGYERKVADSDILQPDGTVIESGQEYWVERPDREEQELLYYQKNYKGWDKLIVLPIDQIRITSYSFTDKSRIELIPSEKDRALIEQARMGTDPISTEMANEIPPEVRDYIEQGKLIPLGTDPEEGSFVYHLAGRRGAKDELGQSILDRCHLPGTPVLVKREGQVCQVAISDLDPDTDLVLSTKGVWREFDLGSRHINEGITTLTVSKIDTPIGCTSDHKHTVLREGVEIEVPASAIQPGDYLQVASLPLTECVTEFDLSDFMHGIESTYASRRTGDTSDMLIEVIDKSMDLITVRYRKEQTDPRDINRTTAKNAILTWASTLSEPANMRSSEVCEKFGLNAHTLKDIRHQLVELGYAVRVTKSKIIVFPPNTEQLRASVNNDYVKSFPRYVKLDSDFGYFLGYWLGDGHIAKQAGLNYGTLGFTYGREEPASVLSIERKIKPMLDKMGVGFSETPMPDSTSVNISGQQDVLTRWIAHNFGHVCEDKHLPAWIYDAPAPFLMGLLHGLCDSDGYVTAKKDGSVSVGITNTNKALIDQVFLVCTSLGLPVSNEQLTEGRWVDKEGKLSWAKAAYAVHFTHGPSVKHFFESGFLAKRKDPAVWKNGRSGSRHVSHNGLLYYRVSHVGMGHHEGPVYSLNVHEDHTFFASCLATRNCLRVLYLKEKLRQAQTQIASRAMTPKRIVWAEDISEQDVEDLREQVDLSLVDPDYSIVTNYEVHWDEMGSRDRLLDLQSEYDQANKDTMTGLGVTESLMSGETLYSGDRLKLEVINTRYLFLRELIQEYAEEYLFKPVARRKGFIEKDKWGEEIVLYPKLSFTRLPLRDSQDTYDALFNLYQKGSLPIDIILDMFNIDSDDAKEKIEHDLFTVNDVVFNECIRGMYNDIAGKLVEGSDIVDRISQYLKLKMKPPQSQEEGRF
jgi:hypothetical protein